MTLPIMYTPITKHLASWDGMQDGTCGAHYLDFIRCASRVGHIRADYECKKEHSDLQECLSMTKQLKRTIIMEKERKKQKKPYIEPLGKDIPERGY